jgi:hypothetical protein
MEHPWIDIERNVSCAALLLVWALVLLSLSQMVFTAKLLCLAALGGLLVFHVKRRQLSYEATFACLVASGLLYATDPLILPQTVLLVYVLLLIASVCLFMSVEAFLLFLVFGLAVTYSALLTVAIAMRTDPAFTGLFLLALTTFWLAFLRPARA